MPAARAMATMCKVWLVEPPVASRPITPLMMDFSLTNWAMLYSGLPLMATACATAASSNAVRKSVDGLTKALPGNISPMNSSIIWLELAVP